ncbi:formate/nitrite transporter family protein [Sanguibacter keddieii DSM 10542]|uniref:Formate/nitrite transporter family protein n=1 Tax=Sanguibacter keddieii (strain ATCC 51767 / DSM 10542 / NCFB 3025 / ST-74) TaxID=446469 RepID=D1BI72_SANKS|nr:formate/nitrite transporter family protein [Sanguibacter keddieii]ACZ20046.1 formate/nitrite transporter family protein [Sanguibacter keddieii DSM 10542]
MSYVKPDEVVATAIDAGATKAALSTPELLVRGVLGGAILACATTLAFQATVQTGQPIVGAIIFPVGFIMIVLLGLELVTGSFALIPLAVFTGRATVRGMLRNFGVVLVGHVVGAVGYAAVYVAVISRMGTDTENPLVANLVQIAEAKTIGYEAMGASGLALVFLKAVLCNWMVTLGVVMAMTSRSTGGKIIAMWLPVTTFFAQGFEHAVVNLFVIPAGMMLGADVTVGDWWLWNQLPVLAGNFVGGVLLTGFGLYWAHRRSVESRLALTGDVTGAPTAPVAPTKPAAAASELQDA